MSGGFLHLLKAIFGRDGGTSFEFQVRIEDELVVQLGFSE